MRIQSSIYESARNLYRGLQTFTTRHSNRKLSIVMAFSSQPRLRNAPQKLYQIRKNNAK